MQSGFQEYGVKFSEYYSQIDIRPKRGDGSSLQSSEDHELSEEQRSRVIAVLRNKVGITPFERGKNYLFGERQNIIFDLKTTSYKIEQLDKTSDGPGIPDWRFYVMIAACGFRPTWPTEDRFERDGCYREGVMIYADSTLRLFALSLSSQFYLRHYQPSSDKVPYIPRAGQLGPNGDPRRSDPAWFYPSRFWRQIGSAEEPDLEALDRAIESYTYGKQQEIVTE